MQSRRYTLFLSKLNSLPSIYFSAKKKRCKTKLTLAKITQQLLLPKLFDQEHNNSQPYTTHAHTCCSSLCLHA